MRTEWCKMERFHLAPPSVAMTAGCVGMHQSWQCSHLWHQGTLGSVCVCVSVPVYVCACFERHKNVGMLLDFTFE